MTDKKKKIYAATFRNASEFSSETTFYSRGIILPYNFSKFVLSEIVHSQDFNSNLKISENQMSVASFKGGKIKHELGVASYEFRYTSYEFTPTS